MFLLALGIVSGTTRDTDFQNAQEEDTAGQELPGSRQAKRSVPVGEASHNAHRSGGEGLYQTIVSSPSPKEKRRASKRIATAFDHPTGIETGRVREAERFRHSRRDMRSCPRCEFGEMMEPAGPVHPTMAHETSVDLFEFIPFAHSLVADGHSAHGTDLAPEMPLELHQLDTTLKTMTNESWSPECGTPIVRLFEVAD